jgi:hypothetical protein
MRHRLARMQQGWFDDSAPQAREAKNRDDLRLRRLREQWEEHLRKGETTNPESDGELPF